MGFAEVYGYLPGLILAILAMSVADVCAGVIALHIGRSCWRPTMRGMLETDQRFRVIYAIEMLMEVRGIEMTLVVKMAPISNGILSYLLGSTPVSTIDFTIASTIASFLYISITCFATTTATHPGGFWKTVSSSPLCTVAFVVCGLAV